MASTGWAKQGCMSKMALCYRRRSSCGSVLTLDESVRRMRAFTGADLAISIQLAWRNPHRMFGWPDDFGVGSDARLNVYSDDGARRATILRGVLLQ